MANPYSLVTCSSSVVHGLPVEHLVEGQHRDVEDPQAVQLARHDLFVDRCLADVERLPLGLEEHLGPGERRVREARIHRVEAPLLGEAVALHQVLDFGQALIRVWRDGLFHRLHGLHHDLVGVLVAVLRAVRLQRVCQLDLIASQLAVVDIAYPIALVDTPPQGDRVLKCASSVGGRRATRAGLVEREHRSDLVGHVEEEPPADHGGSVHGVNVRVQVTGDQVFETDETGSGVGLSHRSIIANS